MNNNKHHLEKKDPKYNKDKKNKIDRLFKNVELIKTKNIINLKFIFKNFYILFYNVKIFKFKKKNKD